MQKNIFDNIEEYYSISENLASVIIKFNKRYKMRVVQAYAPTSSHEDHLVECFYEDVESAISKVTVYYSDE